VVEPRKNGTGEDGGATAGRDGAVDPTKVRVVPSAANDNRSSPAARLVRVLALIGAAMLVGAVLWTSLH